MNINNPYVLLRLLILVDLSLLIAGTYLPLFSEISILQIFNGFESWDARAKINNLSFICGHLAKFVALVMLMMVQRHGRTLYLLSIPLFMVTVIVNGVSVTEKVLVDGAIYLSMVYSGFLIGALFFSPVAVLFRKMR